MAWRVEPSVVSQTNATRSTPQNEILIFALAPPPPPTVMPIMRKATHNQLIIIMVTVQFCTPTAHVQLYMVCSGDSVSHNDII